MAGTEAAADTGAAADMGAVVAVTEAMAVEAVEEEGAAKQREGVVVATATLSRRRGRWRREEEFPEHFSFHDLEPI